MKILVDQNCSTEWLSLSWDKSFLALTAQKYLKAAREKQRSDNTRDLCCWLFTPQRGLTFVTRVLTEQEAQELEMLGQKFTLLDLVNLNSKRFMKLKIWKKYPLLQGKWWKYEFLDYNKLLLHNFVNISHLEILWCLIMMI